MNVSPPSRVDLRAAPWRLTSLACLALLACDAGGAAPVADVATDATPDAAAEGDSGELADTDAATVDAAEPTPIAPDGYCEAVGASYCAFYLRCGRMAVPDLATCLTVFDEVCNAVYEPYYVALAERGLLALSTPDVAACTAHLEEVACALQPGDLDGPCGGMWRGLTPAGGQCSYGIESLVCDDASACVLGLDFCGTCVAAVGVDEPCDLERRCHADASCLGGVCVARARPTEPCGAPTPCGVGAACVGGVCVAPQVVGLGDACGQSLRCPYKSACVGGVCVATGLLGEVCSAAAPCASGACVGGACVPSTPTFTGCIDGVE